MSEPGSKVPPAYRLYQLAWTGLDWLYPPHCGGCGKANSRWCQDCQQETQIILSACNKCGQPIDVLGECSACQSHPPPYTALRSWAAYDGPLRRALHRMKYERDMALGEILARPLFDLFYHLQWEVDLVTPVPAGVARRSQRGYNQASLLALPLALASGLKYAPRALVKIRETISQVGLTVRQRRENVSEAFEASSEHVAGKRVLVVDDITTSGATIESCACALLAAGAKNVYGLTLAHALLSGHTSNLL